MRAARSFALRSLSEKKWHAFRRALVGQTLTAVVLDRRDARSGRREALTDNYVTVALDGAEGFVGRLATLTIQAVSGRETLGRLMPSDLRYGIGGDHLTESLEGEWPKG
jgi:tRNA A37 methylthiotransferase MiaB